MLPPPLRVALQLLTRFPVGEVSTDRPQAMAASMVWYPAVGLMIGFLLWLLAALLSGLPASLLAVLLLSAWVATTGGLHLDGLADSADGWIGGHGDRARTLEIMGDSRIGGGAVVVLVLVLLLKFVLLQLVLARQETLVLIGAPVVARGAAMLLFRYTEYVRPRGIASELVTDLPNQPVVTAAVVAGLLLWVLGAINLVTLITVALCFLLLRSWMVKRLGGCSGDTAGALIELAEVVVLLVAVS